MGTGGQKLQLAEGTPCGNEDKMTIGVGAKRGCDKSHRSGAASGGKRGAVSKNRLPVRRSAVR
jgi:hypothetical protein